MASRNLTDVFTLMRNNATKNRHFYDEQRLSDRATLVEETLHRGGEVEIGLPPLWTDQLEECQYALNRLESKIRELDSLHENSVQRPQAFSDYSEDSQQIEVLTKEISRMFVNCHNLVSSIKTQSKSGSFTERKLAQNAMSSLVTSLQNASNAFKKTQNNYIKTLSSREEQTEKFLLYDLDTGQVDDELENIDLAFSLGPGQSRTQQQLLLIEEENARVAEEREQEVQQIMNSILDLNEIFKDLAHMVHDQGTVLDRIDYNLENSSIQIHHGFQQLQKAEKYQQKNRKMKCIVGLAAVTLVMFILLVAVKLS